MPKPSFVASVADVKYLKNMPEEFIPYVNFRANQEGRILDGSERVVILNVSTTTSYIAVFLDKEKSIEDVEKEVEESSAILNRDSKKLINDLLKSVR